MYEAASLDSCRARGHRFELFGSDKTPLKLNLRCRDCSDTMKTIVVAYGRDELSWGQWQKKRQSKEGE